MQKKGHKVIQKDILGHLGRVFSTYAGIGKNNNEAYIYKDSKNAVPSVPKYEREILEEFAHREELPFDAQRVTLPLSLFRDLGKDIGSAGGYLM